MFYKPLKHKSILVKNFILLIFFLFPFALSAQVDLKGRVLDAKTKSGVPYATVFVTESTFGVSADEQGYFSLQIPDGTYNVVVRSIGYSRKVFTINTNELNSEGHQISLNPSFGELDYLEVTDERDPIWLKNLATFKQFFLGTSKNGKESRIINEIILRLDSDSEPRTLKVSTPDVLQIENPNLGYRIEYSLEEFTHSEKTGTFFYSGYSRFIEDTTMKRSKGRRIKNNRKRAYLGSIHHLIRSLYEGNAADEGFVFGTMSRSKNPRRPDQAQIDAAKKLLAETTDSDVRDSLRRNFTRRERLDPYINRFTERNVADSLLVRTDEVGRKFLVFEDLLHVVYTKERESDQYLNELPPKKPGWQQSFLELGRSEVEIFPNGTYGVRSGIFLEGYMGWEKVGELLPLDYTVGN